MRNARFWEYVNGDVVKITLKPGQTLHWRQAHQTDEGWSSEEHTWSYVADPLVPHVLNEYVNDGRDCDGRLTRFTDSECLLDLLQAGNESYAIDPPVRYPAWQKVGSSQRDYAAEAAGY